jgi:queuosine precursor transporter
VITITHFYLHALPIDPESPVWPQLWLFIVTSYSFKFVAALLDTLPFYLGTAWLRRYLGIGEADVPPP